MKNAKIQKIDYAAVFEKLPTKFTRKDIVSAGGSYYSHAKLIHDGLIKKVAFGVYKKIRNDVTAISSDVKKVASGVSESNDKLLNAIKFIPEALISSAYIHLCDIYTKQRLVMAYAEGAKDAEAAIRSVHPGFSLGM